MTELDSCEEYSLLEIAYLAAEQRGTDLGERREIFDRLVGHARDCDACGRRFLQLMSERERKRERLAMQAERDAADAALAETLSADTPVEAAPEPAEEPLLARWARKLGLTAIAPIGLCPVQGVSAATIEYGVDPYESPVCGRLTYDYPPGRPRTRLTIAANGRYEDRGELQVFLLLEDAGVPFRVEMAIDDGSYVAELSGIIEPITEEADLRQAPWLAWSDR